MLSTSVLGNAGLPRIDNADKNLLLWLLDSGVLIGASHHPAYGGVHAGYDVRSGKWLFVYSEITGYAASMFCRLHEVTGDARYLCAAETCAAFLLRYQAPGNSGPAAGAFPQGFALPDMTVMARHYSFDAAMCIQGLLDLYRINGDPALRNAAKAAGEWLLSMKDPSSGGFFSSVEANTGCREHAGPNFHEDLGCLHAKHAIALLKLHEATGDIKYKHSAVEVCDWVLSLQDRDGAFWANAARSYVYTHAHCYATEGLLFASHRLGEPRYRAAVDRACAWLGNSIVESHGILGTHKVASSFEPDETKASHNALRLFRRIHPRREIATDATAQAARLFIYRYLRGDGDQGLEHARTILRALVSRSMYRGAIPLGKGGLHSRFDISLGWPRPSSIIATWGVLFALHAYLLLNAASEEVRGVPIVDALVEGLF